MFFKNLIVLLATLVILVGFNLMEGCGGGGEIGSDVISEQSGQDGLETEMVNEVFNPLCAKDKDCDDKITCTEDKCLQGGCQHVPDNNKCGTGEVCNIDKEGCVKAKSCFSDADCKDKLKCTVEGCDQQTHLCQQIYDDSRCPQGYICFSPVEFDDDGEGSTDEEYSGCLPTSRCQNDSDCLPNESSCAIGKCVAKICVYTSNSAKCDNGDMCDGQEFCQADEYECGFSDHSYYYSFPEYCNKYQCHQAENGLTCDDKNPCTADWCDPKKGCIYENNSAPCEDGEICTEDDKCSNGICVSGSLLTCDDKNPCTKDYCKEGTPSNCYNNQYDVMICQDISQDISTDSEIVGCNHKPEPSMEGVGCETLCLKDGICSAGKCSAGTVVDCDDKNPCTEDWCDPFEGCKSKIVVECGLNEKCCNESCCSSEQVCYNNYCCSPDCKDKECGDDGCGGSCGVCGCGNECQNEKCVFTACAGKQCGDDGCGGSCGSCGCGDECQNGKCIFTACFNKECGDDGCGGSCGTCSQFPNSFCDSGICKCNNKCTDKECGDDGCGGSCGECSGCGIECIADKCKFTACEGKQCGDDDCGGSCGTCPCGHECQNGQCVFTACIKKQCGDDGCGGSCGSCLNPCECTDGKCDSVKWIDNGNQTVTDCKIKKVWQKKAEVKKPWSEAMSYCDTLELSGYSDWVLPTIGELSSLLLYSEMNNCYIDPIFEGPCDYYWSSSCSYIQGLGDVCREVAFSVASIFWNDKYYSEYVRCVR